MDCQYCKIAKNGICATCYRKRYKRRRYERRSKQLDEFFANGCRICGESRRPALDAAHWPAPLNGKRKSRVTLSEREWNEELARCIPLCATCHRLVDAGWITPE